MPTVLISGTNRGLGLEFVRQYAADKWNVIACCRNPAKADKLQALAKDNKSISIEALDVTDFTAIKNLAAKLENTPIDVLINNAGILSGANGSATARSGDESQSFGSVDGDAWTKVMQVNVLSPLKMTEAFVGHVAKSNQRKIIMISSGWGSITAMDGDLYAYKVSKAALNAVTKNLASDLKNKNICVIAFRPGWVKTDMGSDEAALTPAESIGDMRKVIAGLTLKQTGQFMERDGKISPW